MAGKDRKNLVVEGFLFRGGPKSTILERLVVRAVVPCLEYTACVGIIVGRFGCENRGKGVIYSEIWTGNGRLRDWSYRVMMGADIPLKIY